MHFLVQIVYRRIASKQNKSEITPLSTHMRIFFLAVVSLLTAQIVVAQKPPKYTEFGISAGNLVYTGSFSPNSGVGTWMQEQGGRFGVALRRNFRPWFNLGVETNYGWFNLDDVNHGRAQRDIQVRTSVLNVNAAAEFIFVRYGKFHYINDFAPYLKIGTGANFFNPNISDNFANLPSEVSVYPFSYSSMNVFMGFGFKFRTSYKTSLSVEVMMHNSGTNRMGGVVSNFGNASNDRYGGIFLHFTRLFF
ncbi:MAG: hypothetical protein EA358_08990 [Flavobacteriales bacterium]|nr:MAG: hypothetical protein EA358_08990 [Flavobacteriales bacterium]